MLEHFNPTLVTAVSTMLAPFISSSPSRELSSGFVPLKDDIAPSAVALDLLIANCDVSRVENVQAIFTFLGNVTRIVSTPLLEVKINPTAKGYLDRLKQIASLLEKNIQAYFPRVYAELIQLRNKAGKILDTIEKKVILDAIEKKVEGTENFSERRIQPITDFFIGFTPSNEATTEKREAAAPTPVPARSDAEYGTRPVSPSRTHFALHSATTSRTLASPKEQEGHDSDFAPKGNCCLL